jgi:PEP-CTERM motif
VDGVTDGQHFGFFGLFQHGVLSWSGPVIVTTPSATYQISLSDVVFNAGFLGLHPGERHGATVEATITQIDSPVPEPSTVVMAALAMGPLGLFGLIRRRRAARAQASLGQADSATVA